MTKCCETFGYKKFGWHIRIHEWNYEINYCDYEITLVWLLIFTVAMCFARSRPDNREVNNFFLGIPESKRFNDGWRLSRDWNLVWWPTWFSEIILTKGFDLTSNVYHYRCQHNYLLYSPIVFKLIKSSSFSCFNILFLFIWNSLKTKILSLILVKFNTKLASTIQCQSTLRLLTWKLVFDW